MKKNENVKSFFLTFVSLLVLLVLLGCEKDAPNLTEEEMIENVSDLQTATLRGSTIVQTAPVFTFQPAGDFGGADNVLTPGDMFPPGPNSSATLKRGSNFLHFNIHTSGLPPGAYTVWWIIFNYPSDCADPNPAGGLCAGTPESADIFLSNAAIIWATGKEVQANGIGNFNDMLYIDEHRSEYFHIGSALNSPLENPQGAEVHFAIKYHGLASDDPEEFYTQTHTLTGGCDASDGANSYDLNFLPAPIGPFQCFDPQAVVFPAP